MWPIHLRIHTALATAIMDGLGTGTTVMDTGGSTTTGNVT